MSRWEEFFYSPLAGIFWLVVFVRNWLFDKGYLKTQKFNVPIISVGNLTAGGTGKTPLVATIVETFKASGKKVAIVSRGYKGNYKEEAAKVENVRADATDIFGDEPVWFVNKLQVPVYVGRERVKAIEMCIRNEKPDVIIADDGFQHRWFERDHNILLLDVTEESELFLPAGRWREPFSSAKRATLILLTKTNLVTRDQLSLWEERVGDLGFYYEKGNLFKVDYFLESLSRVHGAMELHPGDNVELGSSIARPESFSALIEKNYKIIKHWILPDHSQWTQIDIDLIEKHANTLKCPHLILTEKDYVKVQNFDFIDLNLWLARLGLKFEPSSDEFYQKITEKTDSIAH